MSTKDNIESPYFTAKRGGKYTGLSEAFMKRMMRAGKIEAYKVEKFWITTKAALDKFIANGKGNGKAVMKKETKDKIKFHAQLRSLKGIPGNIEKIEGKISMLKEGMQEEEGLEKVMSIIRLKTALMLKKEKERKEADMPSDLSEMANRLFPEILPLVDHDPDTLEQMFLEEINGAQEEQNTNVMEAGATDNQDGATIVEVHIDEGEGE